MEHATWDDRKERLMRDYLRAHPDAAQVYGALKDALAATLPHESPAYTKAKTAFIQDIIDQARAGRGVPRIDGWNEEHQCGVPCRPA